MSKKVKVFSILLAVLLTLSVFAGCKTQPAEQEITITIWHSWSGSELEVLNDAITQYNTLHPKVTIDTLQTPFDQLQNKYQTEAASGGGPDILVGPADWIGPFTTANLISPIDDYVDSSFLSHYVTGAVDQVKISGKMMAMPESTECVAMIYNKSMVTQLPATTDDLKTFADSVQSGTTYGFVYHVGFYQTAGYFFAAGMQLFDANNNSIVAQGDGGATALTFIKNMAADPKLIVANDYGKADSMFKEGKAAIIINGPWATGDYVTALGAENVGVAPMPALSATGQPFAPFVNTKDFFLNANSDADHKTAAMNFIKFLVSKDIEQLFFEKAKHIPSNTDVDTSADPVIDGFKKQMLTGVSMPIITEMGQVWNPMQTAIDSVMAGKGGTPAELMQAAQTSIQKGIDQARGG
jgi:arabinogalactan oligomer/maltooligosaccharide transport system substrate-binding protein